MFSASLRRCNGAKCWLCTLTDGKRGAEWVFANGRFGFSMNAEKEQLSASAGSAGEVKGRRRAHMHATALWSGHGIAGVVRIRSRT